MNEPTKKKMLARLKLLQEICWANPAITGTNSHCPECPCGVCEHELDAIRILIENRPEVTLEWVGEKAADLANEWGHLALPNPIPFLKAMLREAGIGIKEKK